MARSERRAPVSADDLLERMVRDYGVSARFVEAARPIVERLFTEVPAQRRAACIGVIREIFARQAETERAVRGASEGLRRLAGNLN